MKRMKWMTCLMLCALLVLLAGGAQAASLTVTGSATVKAEPDRAVVLLGVQETEADVTQAQAKVNGKISAILKALEEDEEYPIASEDITTEQYDISPRYEYGEKNQQVLTGYRAECVLSIVVRDIDRVGRVIDAAFAAGANEMDSIRFELSDTAQVNDQALTLALENALHKAQLLAQAAGIDLSTCEMNLTANADSDVSSSRNVLYMTAEAMDADGTSVRGGQLSFTASVSLTYSDGK